MSECSADKRARLTFIRQRDPTLFLMVDIELGTGNPGVPSTFPPYSGTTEAWSRSEVRLAWRSIGLESIQGQIPAVIHRPWGSACFFFPLTAHSQTAAAPIWLCGDVVAPRMVVFDRGATMLQRGHLHLSLLGQESFFLANCQDVGV